MRLSTSVWTAIAILAVILVYFGVSALFGGGGDDEVAASEETRFAVIAEPVKTRQWSEVVVVRGVTEAKRKVDVRTETAGVVAATPVAEGAEVREGDVLCRLKVDARRASLAEAEAAQTKARLDYQASEKLAAEGFRSENALAAQKAALDQASAAVAQARVRLDQTEIRAPFDGVFDRRAVDAGDFMNVGDACGALIQRTPFLVTGGVAEKDIGKISVGDPGEATLVTGESLAGKVTFVSTAADPQTRTFRVELEVPNEDGGLKDGMTATFRVIATPRDAVLARRSTLVLNDEGAIGVRTVDAGGAVSFRPVRLLGESPEGVFITGLKDGETVIVRGQEFVRAGQLVSVAASEGGAP